MGEDSLSKVEGKEIWDQQTMDGLGEIIPVDVCEGVGWKGMVFVWDGCK